MNRITFINKIILTCIMLLVGVISWGQTPTLSGSGTEESPYLITSVADWNIFATEDNAANYWASGVYVRLDADITVSTMVGTSDYKYQGTFDGNWNTLDFKKGTTEIPFTEDRCAPFRYINNATIRNLKTTGTIVSTKTYTGGLVASVYGTSYIKNCISSMTIDCSKVNHSGGDQTGNYKKWDCSAGGFVAQCENGSKLYFENCIFDGSIDKGDNTYANRGAGYVSYINGYTEFKNCLMAGYINLMAGYTYNNIYQSTLSTFARPDNSKYKYSGQCLYCADYGDVPSGTTCVQASNVNPDGVYKKYTVSGSDYYVSVVVTGFETTTYSYTGNDIVITPALTYYGWTLTEDTDYEISYEKKNGETWESASVINAAGDYRIIISGKGNYAGSYTSPTIHVVNYNSWAVVKAALADDSEGDRNITLSADIYPENPSGADVALEVNGTVVLNLNGHTIDRKLFSVNPQADPVVKGQVIRVNAGANLTINGSGTIKGGYNKSENGTEDGINNDGGGIFNKGTLVMNNVVVTENKCVKYDLTAVEYTSRGGGVYNGSGSSFTMTGGKIINNECLGGGAGVYCNNASVFSMNGVEVSNNTSESKGGGVRIKTSNSVTATLSNCIIQMNFATGNSNIDGGAAQGGGIFMEAGHLDLDQCSICGNQSTFAGAGLYSHGGNINAKNCDIYWNGTYYESNKMVGGGVCLNNNSVFTMDGGSIYGNNSYQDGGGIYVADNATCNVKGDVKIYDSYKAGIMSGATDNNAYLDGASVINVVGPLADDAVIHITPSSTSAKTYVKFAEGVTDHAEAMTHFQVDSDDYSKILDDDGNIEVYEPYPWNETTTWDDTKAESSAGSEIVPTSGSTVTIHRSVRIPTSYVAYAGSISVDQYCYIIIEDGGQLITNTTGDVAVMAKKDVDEADENGWNLISSPVANPNIADNTNLVTGTSAYPTYDLYRFNEAVDLQWENYRASHEDFTTLQNGRGYLYRNADDHTIEISGSLNVEDVNCMLSYNETTSPSGKENILKGFNLIGNPYSQNITMLNTTLVDDNDVQIEDDDENPINLTGFYRLTSDGSAWTAEITDTLTTIAPLEGFLVQVPADAKKVKFSKTARAAKRANGDNIMFAIANDKYEDVAYASFEKGLDLNKIEHVNADVPVLYIRKDCEDYAIATMNHDTKVVNLNFEAKTTGFYTLSVKPQGEYGYLHLIDKLAGEDIDLLKENEYRFVASPADEADRFIVRLGLSGNSDNSDNEVFAYQSGNDIVVSGEGELQIYDVIGRFVMKQRVNGVEIVRMPSKAGEYILRLVGDETRTQKIIVR